jgi:hypothetical protein
MPGNEYEVALDDFIECLNRARDVAGTPSFEHVAKVSERLHMQSRDLKVDVLAGSTIQEILRGRRKQPPKWPWVLSYVTVLHEIARRAQVEAGGVGSLDEWKCKLDAVRAAYNREAHRPPGNGGRHRKQDEHGEPAAGKVPPQRNARLGRVADGEDALRGQFFHLLSQTGAEHWWHHYRDVAPEWLEFYLYLESVADAIGTYEPRIVPGLLQTEEYARAVLTRYSPDASEREVARLLELRMARQELLGALVPCHVRATIEISALRDPQIDRRTRREQISHLIDLADDPRIIMQIALRSGLDEGGMIGESITHFHFPEEHIGDVVFTERISGGFFLIDRAEIDQYCETLSRIGRRAEQPPRVPDVLRRTLREI